MAKGDSVTDLQTISSGANLDFQPAAGVEVLIGEFSNEAGIVVHLINGTQNDALVVNISGSEDRPFKKLFINNTNYLRLNEASAAERDMGYSGIQTK